MGVTDHTVFPLIYFFDPNGRRVELAAQTDTPEMVRKFKAVEWDMLNEWSRTKRALVPAAWINTKELGAPNQRSWW